MKEKFKFLLSFLRRQNVLVHRLDVLEHEHAQLIRQFHILERTDSEKDLSRELHRAREEFEAMKAEIVNVESHAKRYLKLAMEAQSEVAVLRYRNFELAQDNKRLTMNLAGERGHAKILEQKARILEEQIVGMKTQSTAGSDEGAGKRTS